MVVAAPGHVEFADGAGIPEQGRAGEVEVEVEVETETEVQGLKVTGYRGRRWTRWTWWTGWTSARDGFLRARHEGLFGELDRGNDGQRLRVRLGPAR